MVFSHPADSEFESARNGGRALVIPFSRSVRSVTDLLDEAVGLWTAETSNGDNPHSRISSRRGWGRVAILENPKRPLSDNLRTGWTRKVCDEVGYRPAMKAKVPVDSSGFLTIPWPESANLRIDALLAAVTDPTVDENGHYPSVNRIAGAWSSPDGRKYVGYFCKNRACGIKTFQDETIKACLRELWQ